MTLSLWLSFEILKQYEDYQYYEDAMKAFDVLGGYGSENP